MAIIEIEEQGREHACSDRGKYTVAQKVALGVMNGTKIRDTKFMKCANCCKTLGILLKNQILVEIGIKQIDWMKEDFHLENINAQC